MFGRGIEEFGRDVGDAYSVIHQRETQAETSDAYASIAEARFAFADKIQQGTNDGTLNVDKVKKEYQDWIEKQYDTYNTSGGKNAFNRAAARTGGSLVQSAAHGYAAIQGKKASDNLTTLMEHKFQFGRERPISVPGSLRAPNRSFARSSGLGSAYATSSRSNA